MMLIFKGCTTDDLSNESDSLDQNIQALTTRTTVAITKCVDAYVNIGGYEEYNGTHCWTEYYETGGGGSGGALSGDEYYPDSYPASEGGGSWVPGTSQQFNYSNLNKLYAPGSTTNLAFKENLNEILGQFIQRGDSYASVFDLLIESHAKIKFVINPNIEYEALYDKNCETIFSKDISSISLFAFSEELLHAAQHQCFLWKYNGYAI